MLLITTWLLYYINFFNKNKSMEYNKSIEYNKSMEYNKKPLVPPRSTPHHTNKNIQSFIDEYKNL